jgi:nucleoside-diphosphate-sugar epimerase
MAASARWASSRARRSRARRERARARHGQQRLRRRRHRARGRGARHGHHRPGAGAPREPWQRRLGEWSEADLGEALDGVDTVVHSAALVHQPGAPREAYARFNVDGVRALIAACRARGVRRVVNLSTIKVYGETPAGAIDEDTPVAPESPYAATKLEAEQLLRAAAADGGPEHLSLRLCPVFGVGDKGNVRTMIVAIARRRFAVPGAGDNRKSLVHVDTVAELALAACLSRSQGALVIADHDVPSIGQLSDLIARALGRRKPPRIPSPLLFGAAYGCELGFRALRREAKVSRALIAKALAATVCNPARAERELGVTCHTDLYPALCEEVSWLRGIAAI